MTAPRPRASGSSNPCLGARSIPWMRSLPPGSRRFRPEPGWAPLHPAAAPELEGRHGDAIARPRHGQGNVEVDAVEGVDDAVHHAVGLADHAALRVEDRDEQARVSHAAGAVVVEIAPDDGASLLRLTRLNLHAKAPRAHLGVGDSGEQDQEGRGAESGPTTSAYGPPPAHLSHESAETR